MPQGLNYTMLAGNPNVSLEFPEVSFDVFCTRNTTTTTIIQSGSMVTFRFAFQFAPDHLLGMVTLLKPPQ
jgi:hypothetical protein